MNSPSLYSWRAALAILFLVLFAWPVAAEAKQAQRYRDPFAYCAAVGNVDTPDERWAGPKVPMVVVEGFVEAAGLPADTPLEPLRRMTFWRCMEGHVYACAVGANLPCQAKANTSRTPSPAMWQYCQQNPGSDGIPAYVTGRETIYAWRCQGERPKILRQVTKPDARGFLSNIWYKILQDPR